MQLDVDDIAGAFQLTDFYEDAAYLSSVSFIGMNEMSQFVYKATWLYTTPEAAAPQNIYISVRYSPNTYGIDFYADY
jgi:hypothetical protein